MCAAITLSMATLFPELLVFEGSSLASVLDTELSIVSYLAVVAPLSIVVFLIGHRQIDLVSIGRSAPYMLMTILAPGVLLLFMGADGYLALIATFATFSTIYMRGEEIGGVFRRDVS